MGQLRRSLRRWWPIDLTALGLGVALMVIYASSQDVLAARHKAWDSLLPNLATEILGVWISVRVIDAMIGARRERERVRSAIVGNLNHMMKICQDVPPHFDSWRLNDLGNEITWFEEKQQHPDGLKQLTRYVTQPERLLLESTVAAVREVARVGQATAGHLGRLRVLDDYGSRPNLEGLAASLEAAWHYLKGHTRDHDPALAGLAKVRATIPTSGLDTVAAENASALLSAAEQVVLGLKHTYNAVATVENRQRDLRRLVAADES